MAKGKHTDTDSGVVAAGLQVERLTHDHLEQIFVHSLAPRFVKHTPGQVHRIDIRVAQTVELYANQSGTGLVGVELNRLGYTNVDAMDLSRGMLDEAGRKGVYENLLQMVMGEPLDLETGSYDAAIGVGVFTLGHAPANSFDELARVVRPGGFVSFTLRPDVYAQNGFREKQEELESAGIWELTNVTEEFQGMPIGEPEVLFQVWTYRIRPR